MFRKLIAKIRPNRKVVVLIDFDGGECLRIARKIGNDWFATRIGGIHIVKLNPDGTTLRVKFGKYSGNAKYSRSFVCHWLPYE